MSRTCRRWIIAVVVALLALSAAPVVARHGHGHDCCGGVTATAAHHGDCASDAAAPLAAPADTEGGSVGDPAAANPCMHCIAATLSASAAGANVPPSLQYKASAYIAPPDASPFVPAAPVYRLDRPPKLVAR